MFLALRIVLFNMRFRELASVSPTKTFQLYAPAAWKDAARHNGREGMDCERVVGLRGGGCCEGSGVDGESKEEEGRKMHLGMNGGDA